jgi:hypothetical protein
VLLVCLWAGRCVGGCGCWGGRGSREGRAVACGATHRCHYCSTLFMCMSVRVVHGRVWVIVGEWWVVGEGVRRDPPLPLT